MSNQEPEEVKKGSLFPPGVFPLIDIAEEKIRIYVDTLVGARIMLTVYKSDFILNIKNKIHRIEGLAIQKQKLVYRDEELKDSSRIMDYPITGGSVLKLLIAMKDGPIVSYKRSITLDKKTLKLLWKMRQKGYLSYEYSGNSAIIMFRERDASKVLRMLDSTEDDVSERTDNSFVSDGKDVYLNSHNSHCETAEGNEEINEIMNIKRFSKYRYDGPSGRSYNVHESMLLEREGKKKRNSCLLPDISTRELINEQNKSMIDKRAEIKNAKAEENNVTKNKMTELREKLKKMVVSEVNGEEEPVSNDYREIKEVEPVYRVYESVCPTTFYEISGPEVNTVTQNLTPSLLEKSCEVSVSLPSLIIDSSSKKDVFQIMKNQVSMSDKNHDNESSVYHSEDIKSSGCDSEFMVLERENGRLQDEQNIKHSTTSWINTCASSTSSLSDKSDKKEVILPSRKNMESSELFTDDGKMDNGFELNGDYSCFERSYEPLPSIRKNPIVIDSDYSSLESYILPEHLPAIVKKPIVVINNNTDEVTPPTTTTVTKKPRCSQCKKKLHIAASYNCKCNLQFCPHHRYPETHNCTFDYKEEGRKIIARNNPLIIADKLPKI